MDDLGDRMKMYEARETTRFMPMLPIYCRIDGRCFSAFTKGMDRPFDENLSSVMANATAALVKETGALAGYTQSDEISLLWHSDDPRSQIFFDGKKQKIVSITAALATSIFASWAYHIWPEKMKKPIVFDSRAFQIPNKTEAANAFLWREKDATKNAISMAARTEYSHKELQGKSGSEMQEMLFQKGINFNSYPAFFKRGVFFQRKTVNRVLTDSELQSIPPKHRPSGPVERQVIARVDMPSFAKVTNRVGVLFDGESPETDRAVAA